MNKSIAMMYLDVHSIKEFLSKKNLAIFIAILVFFAAVMDSPASAIGMFMIYGMFYSGYPFAMGEKVRLDVLYASLPLPQKSLIFGRYLFALMVNLVTGLVAFATCMVVAMAKQVPVSPMETLFTVAACFFLYSAMEFVQFPVFFKMGYNKARLIILLPFLGLVSAGVIVAQTSGAGSFGLLIGSLSQWISSNTQLLIVVVLALWLLLFLVSMRLSLHFYTKREI